MDTYKWKIKVFLEGTPEEWVEHQIEVTDLFNAGGYTTADQKISIYRAVYDGKAKDLFRYYHNARTVKNQDKPIGERVGVDEVLTLTINDMARKMFGNQWSTAARTQKGYLRKTLYMGDMEPDYFYERLKKINSYLPYFPYKDRMGTFKTLEEDELIDIIDQAKKDEWHITMLSQGKRPDDYPTTEVYMEYLKQLYAADKISKLLSPEKKSDKQKERDENNEYLSRKKRRRSDKPGRGKRCQHCDKFHRAPESECWENPANKSDKTRQNKRKGEYPKKEYKYFANWLRTLEKKRANERKVKKETKKDAGSDSEVTTNSEFEAHMMRLRGEHDNEECSINSEVSDSNNGLEIQSTYHFSTPPERTAKRTKTHHYSPEVVVEITDQNGELKPIRASLDTGTSATILQRDFVRKGSAKTKRT